MGRLRTLAILGCLTLGIVVTATRIAGVDWGWLFAHDSVGPVLAALTVSLIAGVAHFGLRWVRWQFLLRRRTHAVRTLDSAIAYVATLPALLLPLFLGEFARVAALAGRYRAQRSVFLAAWLVERVADLVTLVLLLQLTSHSPRGAAAAVVLLGLTVALGRWGGLWSTPDAIVPLALGFASWAVLAVGLASSMLLLGRDVGFAAAAQLFSSATLVGAVTGLPFGTGVTGAWLIDGLTAAGAGAERAVAAVALFRAATLWVPVSVGAVMLATNRRAIRRLVAGGTEIDHFDTLAPAYAAEIPAAVQQLLLERKIARTRRALAEAGIPDHARGLDLGCGQGWYLAEMARAGHAMCGLDRSIGQITAAREYLRTRRAPSPVAVGDATALPYADGAFDFVYCVNAVHHMCAPGAQAHAFAEMVRVLRPGGTVLLHEINTENPLFRLYMGYVFPLVRRIDDGTEQWVRPTALPPVDGGAWAARVDYFTFIPDFAPAWLLRRVDGLEQWLARSRWCRYSAHYLAVFRKDDAEDLAA